MSPQNKIEALEKLKGLPATPARPAKKEPQLTSKFERKGDALSVELTGLSEEGVDESAADAFLRERGEDPAKWEVSSFRSSEWPVGDEMRVSRAYTFKPRPGAMMVDLPDLDDLHAAVQRADPEAYTPVTSLSARRSVVGVIADVQAGKASSSRGGTKELLERLEVSRQKFETYLRESALGVDEIILLDAGDAIEGFENQLEQAQTNDLTLTEQIRVWRRILWSWVDTAARYAPSVKVLAVSSNHGRVRKGKAAVAGPANDYGLEVLAQVEDITSANPDRYSHVEFYAPGPHDESVAIELAGGKVLGLAHGHQASRPEGLQKWLEGQAAGRSPVGGADIVVFGHFHHLRVQPWGDDRWFFIAPTSDNGSDWFRNISGVESKPGVMSIMVDEDGWSDLRVH